MFDKVIIFNFTVLVPLQQWYFSNS